MIAYTLMLGTIFGISVIVNNGTKMDRKKKNRLILKLGILLIWGMCALKRKQWGLISRDINGYMSSLHIGHGLVLVMYTSKRDIHCSCNYSQRMEFRFKYSTHSFIALIYFPWYLFLKRYSQMPTLSLLIYICYQFWVFNMSGLRQGIAHVYVLIVIRTT